MFSILISLILILQLMLPCPALSPQDTRFLPRDAQPQAHRLMWGMIDPELSAWFARIPMNGETDGLPIRWNWTWRGFWAALFEQPMLKEAAADAPSI